MWNSSPIPLVMRSSRAAACTDSWRRHMARRVLLALAISVLAGPAVSAQGTWTPSGLQGTETGILVRDAQGHMLAASQQGVFRSTDHGHTWTVTPLTNNTRSLAITPDGVGLATFFNLDLISDALARSTDQGITWTSGRRPGYAKALDIDAQGRPVIMEADHLLRSEDGGATWTMLSKDGFSDDFFDFRHLAMGPDNLIVLGNGGITGGLVFASKDNGQNWSQIHNAGSDMVMIKVAPSGTIFISRPGSFVRSGNGGESWSEVADFNGMPTCMAFHGNDLYASTLTTLYHSSDDGLSWTSISRGAIPGNAVIVAMMADANGDLLAATSAGIYRRDAVASVDGLQGETASLSIRPHPVRGLAVIELPAPARRELRIEVLDLLGRSQGTISAGAPGTRSVTWDAGGLAAGIYLIRMELDGAVTTRRVVVAR